MCDLFVSFSRCIATKKPSIGMEVLGHLVALLLVRFFARAASSLVPLIRPLAPHSVRCSRAPLYSLVCLLAYSRVMVVFDVSV